VTFRSGASHSFYSRAVLTRSEQGERAAAGLRAHWRTQCAYVAGGEVAEHDGLLVTATRLADPTLNVAFADGPVRDPARALDWFEDWFRARGLDPGIELRVGRHHEIESLLVTRGFTAVVRRPAMTLHPIAVADVAVPRVTVRAVAGDADLAAFHAIQGAAFDMTPEVAAEFLPRRALDLPGIRWLLAWYDDVPCATAAVSVSEHGAGIVGVATLVAYRRRGVGRAVTAAAVREGAALGAELAWLYPTPMARGLYASLGFAVLDEEAEVWVSRG
jgi:ribosomal protein S18 acetylase RimI-like enzyme